MEKQTERSTATGTSRQRASARSRVQQPPEAREERPDPDEIRILAYEIYETRCTTGMLGDPVSDWLDAERRLGGEAGPDASGTAGTGSGGTGKRSTGTGARRQPAGK